MLRRMVRLELLSNTKREHFPLARLSWRKSSTDLVCRLSRGSQQNTAASRSGHGVPNGPWGWIF